MVSETSNFNIPWLIIIFPFTVVPYVRAPNLGLDVEEIRVNNERRFLQELHFALHVNCGGTIAISLENQNPEALATCLKNVIGDKFDGKFVVEVPMVDPRVASSAHSRDLKDEMVGNCQWSVWNKFFAATGQSSHVEVSHHRLSVLLILKEFSACVGAHTRAATRRGAAPLAGRDRRLAGDSPRLLSWRQRQLPGTADKAS